MPGTTMNLPNSSLPLRWFSLRAGVAAALIGFGDWLFWDHRIGLSLALFIAALAIAVVGTNRARASRPLVAAASAVLMAGLLALVEDVNALSVLFGVTGLGFFALALTSPDARWPDYLRAMLRLPFVGPFRLWSDWLRMLRLRRHAHSNHAFDLIGWLVPLALLATFTILFASANPVLESWLGAIDLKALLQAIFSGRSIFWFLLLLLVWPLIRMRKVCPAAPYPAGPAAPEDWGGLLGTSAILRSLVLFNGLFALQTGMDLTYLWAGGTLPNGMSHAAYAHRGAYPLIATALLAAGFVLIVMRESSPARTHKPVRALVLAFVAQNVLLVASSILRLDLYIAAYSLTYLRIAAFIWMGLVALGLVLILVAIMRGKSNAWLLGWNAAALALTLYAACFVNFPDLIARYNLAHCKEISGEGPALDIWYLTNLGPAAIPALDQHGNRLEQAFPGRKIDGIPYAIGGYRNTRMNILEDFRVQYGKAGWRGWGFAAWRLERYLAKVPPLNFAPPSVSGP